MTFPSLPKMNLSLNDQNRVYVSASLVALPLLLLWTWRQRRLSAIEAADMAEAPSKTVVIIGGSVGGINVAHGVLKQIPNAKVILINPSDEFYWNIAAPRVIGKPGDLSREKYTYSIAPLFQKYPHLKIHYEFVLGKATGIDLASKKVTVKENGAPSTPRDIAYDYLVIASGCTSNATTGTNSLKVPFKSSTEGGQLDAEIQAAQDAIKAAKSVVIGGAGPVGVEFAGEIAETYPDTDVTLITNTHGVLNGLKESVRQKAAKILKSKGIKLVTNTSVISATVDPSSGKWTVTLSDGKILTTDAYISTTGSVPNNEFIPASILDESGWLEVDTHFRVKKADESVYAVGDITHYTARLGNRVQAQAAVLVSNLKADITGKGKRAEYNPNQTLLVVVPIGKSTGTGQLGSFVPPGFMVGFMKGKDYFTSQAKGFLAGK